MSVTLVKEPPTTKPQLQLAPSQARHAEPSPAPNSHPSAYPIQHPSGNSHQEAPHSHPSLASAGFSATSNVNVWCADSQQASKRPLAACLATETPSNKRETNSFDLQFLRNCFGSNSGIGESQLLTTYAECGEDREQTFARLCTLSCSRPAHPQPRPAASKRRRKRSDFENDPMGDATPPVSQPATPSKAAAQETAGPQTSDLKHQISVQLIGELLKCQRQEDGYTLVEQALTAFEQQLPRPASQKSDKELAWQNEVLKKGVRSLQSQCDSKIKEANASADQRIREAERMKIEARRCQQESERLQAEARRKIGEYDELKAKATQQERELNGFRNSYNILMNQLIPPPQRGEYGNHGPNGYNGGNPPANFW